jgi:NodT family efflux transporter outer membrane factor (OMF) lipoprotein
MNLKSALLSATLSAALAGCAVGPDYARPGVPVSESYVSRDTLRATATRTDWWAQFGDPLLNRTVERALAGNQGVAQMQARVERSRAAARATGASLGPSIAFDASGARIRNSLGSPIGEIAHAVGAPREYGAYEGNIQASWELDLFGRLRKTREAALADTRGALASEGALRLSVAAETADAYLALRGLQARLDLAEARERTQRQWADLVARRHGEGLAAERDLQVARAALANARSEVAPLRTAIDGQLNRLDVLMGVPVGTYRAELAQTADLPSTPEPSGSLTPADLLRHRPDVVAAEQQLVAANARIGAALAEYYPSFTLAGTLGTANGGLSGLLESDTTQARGLLGLRWRLLDFGRVDAEVAGARGRTAEALAAYRERVLRAGEDVETALSRYAYGRVEVRELEEAVAQSQASRDRARRSYAEGALSLLEVLSADRELQLSSDRLVSARMQLARTCVTIFRALGGGWTERS